MRGFPAQRGPGAGVERHWPVTRDARARRPRSVPQRPPRPAGGAPELKVPRPALLSMALSSSASASSFFSLAFSVSRWRRRLASSAFMPPYWDRQRLQVLGDLEVAEHLGDALPSFSRRSPSRSFRTMLGVCRCLITVVCPPAHHAGLGTATTGGPLPGALVKTLRRPRRPKILVDPRLTVTERAPK